MKTYPLCDPFIWEDIRAFKAAGFGWRQRREGPCASEVVNHIIFVFSLAFVVGTLFQIMYAGSMALCIALSIAGLYCLPAFWALLSIRVGYREGFQSGLEGLLKQKNEAQAALEVEKEAGTKVEGRRLMDLQKPAGTDAYDLYEVIGAGAAPATLTLPTARNPFMNVLVDEFKYNPKRAMAASVYDPSVKVALDDFFRTDFYKDPTDVFGRSQSQRQFITMPSTSIPNDQDSYQNWLYKIPGKTCKEGGRDACLPGTDGAAIPWLSSSS